MVHRASLVTSLTFLSPICMLLSCCLFTVSMWCTGGEPWKPRLQRLAEARQLAPFEKLVLEVLVGCHVSPSVQRTFLANKPGSGMDEMTAMSPLTVSLITLGYGLWS